MRYLYGEADEKFVKVEPRKQKENPLNSYKFRLNNVTEGKANVTEFNKTDVPIVFKITPDTLLNLCVRVIDAIPLPVAASWSIEETCKWLRECGYRQYQNTFRENCINGHNLLLLDASALAAMNIKDFNHIRNITQRIRGLFYLELNKFGLRPEFHLDVYKLFRLKVAVKYDERRSDLWRGMKLIRQREPNYSHWEILEHWLDFEKQSRAKELIGGARRTNLYASNAKSAKEPVTVKHVEHCVCLPPCECYSSESERRPPWLLKCLPHLSRDTEFVEVCGSCLSPCTCRWSSKKYQTRRVLTCLKQALPNKYGGYYGQVRYRKYEQMSRFSYQENLHFNTNIK